jgi:hypothetical protein
LQAFEEQLKIYNEEKQRE